MSRLGVHLIAAGGTLAVLHRKPSRLRRHVIDARDMHAHLPGHRVRAVNEGCMSGCETYGPTRSPDVNPWNKLCAVTFPPIRGGLRLGILDGRLLSPVPPVLAGADQARRIWAGPTSAMIGHAHAITPEIIGNRRR